MLLKMGKGNVTVQESYIFRNVTKNGKRERDSIAIYLEMLLKMGKGNVTV